MTTSYPPFEYSLYDRPDGGVLAYKLLNPTSSDATPLVLVHGLASTGLVDWLPLATVLAQTRPVLFFDNRNMGKSMPPTGGEVAFSVQDLANDTIQLIQHVGWSEIDILGFSMGGSIVLQTLVTSELPIKVNHAVLASTCAKTPRSNLIKDGSLDAPEPEAGDWQALPTASNDPAVLEEQIVALTPLIKGDYDPVFAADPRNGPLIRRRVLEYLNTNRPESTINHQIAAVSNYDVRSQLGVIPASTKVLVTHGTADQAVYYTEHEFIIKGIKHAQHLAFKGIGHAWYDYYTIQYWASMISDFLGDKSVYTPESSS